VTCRLLTATKEVGQLFLILGERHRQTSPERAAVPTWLTIPERGLYTGMIIVGAIGTGKTSACMYPYVEQLLAYRASDPARRVGGLVLEVKGDFCRHVRDILARHGRADDYIEVSLASPYWYNPLHNDLDAYALAYGIATLMLACVGRGIRRERLRRRRAIPTGDEDIQEREPAAQHQERGAEPHSGVRVREAGVDGRLPRLAAELAIRRT
jgi:hypothetical protein